MVLHELLLSDGTLAVEGVALLGGFPCVADGGFDLLGTEDFSVGATRFSGDGFFVKRSAEIITAPMKGLRG